MTMYYIRSKKFPELTVRGTPTYHSLSKNDARLFNSIGKVRAFINAVLKNSYRRGNVPDWQVVEAELVVKNFKEVHEVIKADKLIELLKA